MIENDPTNVVAAFEILLEEIETEIEFVNRVGAKAFEARDYERAREAWSEPPSSPHSATRQTRYVGSGVR